MSSDLINPLGDALTVPVMNQPESIILSGTIRDFKTSHPDMQRGPSGLVLGIVETVLGEDGKPIYSGLETDAIDSAESFDQWYRDVDGINLSKELSIELIDPDGDGIYTYNYTPEFNPIQFFPIDGELFGNDDDGELIPGLPHNYHFTYEINTQFTYIGDIADSLDEILTFEADDDLWVFIDNQLVIDLGGVHPSEMGSVDLDDLGLNPGQNYDLDIFYAERNTTQAKFSIATDIVFETAAPSLEVQKSAALVPTDIDGDGTLEDFTELLEEAPSTLVVGEEHQFRITVENTGNVALDNILVTDAFDARIDLTGAFSFVGDPNGTVAIDTEADTLTWENISLASGESLSLIVNGVLDQGAAFTQIDFSSGTLGNLDENGDPADELERLQNVPFAGFHRSTEFEVTQPDEDGDGIPEAGVYNGAVGPLSELFDGFGQIDNTAVVQVDFNGDGDFDDETDIVETVTDSNQVAAGVVVFDENTGDTGFGFLEDDLTLAITNSRSIGTRGSCRCTPGFEDFELIIDQSGEANLLDFSSNVETDNVTFTLEDDTLTGGDVDVGLSGVIVEVGRGKKSVTVDALGIRARTIRDAFNAIELQAPGTEISLLDLTHAPSKIRHLPKEFGDNIEEIRVDTGKTKLGFWNQKNRVDLSETSISVDPTGGVAEIIFNLGRGSFDQLIAPNTQNEQFREAAFNIKMGSGSHEEVVLFAGDRLDDRVDFGSGKGHFLELRGVDSTDVVITGSRHKFRITGDEIGTDTIINADFVAFDDGIFAVKHLL